MIARHAFNITLSKFSLVFKTLMFVVIVALLLTALMVGLMAPTIAPITDKMDETRLFPDLGKAFGSVFAGNPQLQSDAFNESRLDFEAIIEVVRDGPAIIWLCIFIIFFVYLLFKCFLNIFTYTVSNIGNHYMNSASKFGFVSNMVANAKVACKYSLASSLLEFIYIVIAILLIYGFGVLISMVSVLLMLPCVFCLLVFLMAVKSTFLAYWQPYIIMNDCKVIEAFAASIKIALKKNNFIRNLGSYCVLWLLAISLTILMALPTFGIGLIIVPVFCIVYSRIYSLTLYYNDKKLKYYIDKFTVINSDSVID